MVVLPEPFGPIRPSTSYSASAKETRSTATSPPKRLVTSLTCNAGLATASSMADPQSLQHSLEPSWYPLGGRRSGGAAAEQILDQADDAARNDVDDEQEGHAEQQRSLRREFRRDELPQQRERKDAGQRAPQAMHPAEQRHDHDLEGEERAEGDRRLDIAPTRRHQCSSDGRKGAGDHEQDDLDARGINADMHRDDLVIADDAQREAEPRAADQPADQEDDRGEREQQPIERGGRQRDQHIEPAAGTHDILYPGHDLAHQLGETEREDDKIDAGDA